MSLFSEQATRLLNGLKGAKTAIEAKSGTVKLVGSSPTIEEIITGIGTIKSGDTDTFPLTPLTLLRYNCNTIAPVQGGATWEDHIYADDLLGYLNNYRVITIAVHEIIKPTITWSDNLITQLNS